jgi:hypothetical protein
MFGSTDPHRFRKTVAGSCMVLAPALFLLASVVSPSVPDNTEAALVQTAASDPDRWLAGSLLALAGWALFLPAVLGLMHMLRERGVGFGHAGGALAILGTVAAIANAALALVIWQMASGSTDQMIGLLERLGNETASGIVLFLMPVLVTIGALVLCWGLTASHIAPLWMTLPLALGGVAYAIASVALTQGLFIAASALTLFGLGAIGAMVLGETSEEWEHAPDFHGFGALTH